MWQWKRVKRSCTLGISRYLFGEIFSVKVVRSYIQEMRWISLLSVVTDSEWFINCQALLKSLDGTCLIVFNAWFWFSINSDDWLMDRGKQTAQRVISNYRKTYFYHISNSSSTCRCCQNPKRRSSTIYIRWSPAAWRCQNWFWPYQKIPVKSPDWDRTSWKASLTGLYLHTFTLWYVVRSTVVVCYFWQMSFSLRPKARRPYQTLSSPGGWQRLNKIYRCNKILCYTVM